MVVLFSVLALTFITSCAATYFLARADSSLRILDHPNERSLHRTPIPRTGGLGIWAGGVVGLGTICVLVGPPVELVWVGAAAAIVGVVSFLDDWSRVPAGVRFTSHLAAGVLLFAGGLSTQSIVLPGINVELPPVLGALLSLLLVIWMTNLYNFMDGMDGFAAGMGSIGFGTFSFIGWWAGDVHFALTCAAVSLATAGFLVFNFPPAKIFMGDTGSATLGLLVGGCILWAARADIFPVWIGLLIFSPFVVDATATLLRRVLKREKVWIAHKTHYYQRLVELGWGHRKTVLLEYTLMIGCAVSSIATVVNASIAAGWALMAFWFVLYVSAMVAIRWLERTNRTIKYGSSNEFPR